MTDHFDYDVFVSYRHADPDGGWVRGRLVPRLRADGLAVCIDVDTFRLGAPLVLEMERAVQASRYTLAVLSPRYLQSGFTELENVLAEHLGLDDRGRLATGLRADLVVLDRDWRVRRVMRGGDWVR